jgi:hypothetical protein
MSAFTMPAGTYIPSVAEWAEGGGEAVPLVQLLVLLQLLSTSPSQYQVALATLAIRQTNKNKPIHLLILILLLSSFKQ